MGTETRLEDDEGRGPEGVSGERHHEQHNEHDCGRNGTPIPTTPATTSKSTSHRPPSLTLPPVSPEVAGITIMSRSPSPTSTLRINIEGSDNGKLPRIPRHRRTRARPHLGALFGTGADSPDIVDAEDGELERGAQDGDDGEHLTLALAQSGSRLSPTPSTCFIPPDQTQSKTLSAHRNILSPSDPQTQTSEAVSLSGAGDGEEEEQRGRPRAPSSLGSSSAPTSPVGAGAEAYMQAYSRLHLKNYASPTSPPGGDGTVTFTLAPPPLTTSVSMPEGIPQIREYALPSTSSQGSSTSIAHRPSSIIPPAPIIRKKSGEIVRPSLKKRRPSQSLPPSASLSLTPITASFITEEPCSRPRPRLLADTFVNPLGGGETVSAPVSPTFELTADPLAMHGAALAGAVPLTAVPSTPTKTVKFNDTKLEHVRLFLTGQRPKAVSRVRGRTKEFLSLGSATAYRAGLRVKSEVDSGRWRDVEIGEDTTDGEWSGIEDGSRAERMQMVMKVVNSARLAGGEKGKKAVNAQQWKEDENVRLESLTLANASTPSTSVPSRAQDEPKPSLVGSVRVRNIAFEKTVAARFTLDGWGTRNEVAAHWAGSQPGEKGQNGAGTGFDEFEFRIGLPFAGPPALSRSSLGRGAAKDDGAKDSKDGARQRKMELAIRYCAAGTEMWDNNDGDNYGLVFEWEPAKVAAKAATRGENSILSVSSSNSSVSSEGNSSVASGSDSIGGGRNAQGLAKRYDFAAALKEVERRRGIVGLTDAYYPRKHHGNAYGAGMRFRANGSGSGDTGLGFRRGDGLGSAVGSRRATNVKEVYEVGKANVREKPCAGVDPAVWGGGKEGMIMTPRLTPPNAPHLANDYFGFGLGRHAHGSPRDNADLYEEYEAREHQQQQGRPVAGGRAYTVHGHRSGDGKGAARGRLSGIGLGFGSGSGFGAGFAAGLGSAGHLVNEGHRLDTMSPSIDGSPRIGSGAGRDGGRVRNHHRSYFDAWAMGSTNNSSNNTDNEPRPLLSGSISDSGIHVRVSEAEPSYPSYGGAMPVTAVPRLEVPSLSVSSDTTTVTSPSSSEALSPMSPSIALQAIGIVASDMEQSPDGMHGSGLGFGLTSGFGRAFGMPRGRAYTDGVVGMASVLLDAEAQAASRGIGKAEVAGEKGTYALGFGDDHNQRGPEHKSVIDFGLSPRVVASPVLNSGYNPSISSFPRSHPAHPAHPLHGRTSPIATSSMSETAIDTATTSITLPTLPSLPPTAITTNTKASPTRTRPSPGLTLPLPPRNQNLFAMSAAAEFPEGISLRRSHSASSVEELLSGMSLTLTPSPSLEGRTIEACH